MEILPRTAAGSSAHHPKLKSRGRSDDSLAAEAEDTKTGDADANKDLSLVADQKRKFDNWSVSLKGLCWKSVVNFCLGLEAIEGALRMFWDKSAFGNDDQLPNDQKPDQ